MATASSTTWPDADIVYVAIVGAVMLAAVLEWLLWLLAFLYCLVKVYQKANGPGRWSIRLLAVLNIVFFTCMRLVFLPIMLVTLPLPPALDRALPRPMVAALQAFAFWSFAALLTVPWLFCVYQLVTHSIGRARRIKTVLDEASAPKVVILMPCYNEEPEILLRTVDSLVGSDYPVSCLHVFLSFDGDAENELYLTTIEQLGVPLTLDSYPKSIDVTYRDCRITVSRFPHGGKRSCQKKSFRLIDKIYAEYLRRHDNLFLLFIDSDCILDPACIVNFVYEMELKPGSGPIMLAQTGVITSTTATHSFLTFLQDMEYIHGQLFERSVESGCGAVTCLPGALTCLRFSAFRRMAKYYFADKAEQCVDLFDYCKCHLGEDRWLTHLLMVGARYRYQIQMNTGAFCKTEAVQTFKSLLKQRRRWFLGFVTNEACMLTDVRLWRKYPVLLLLRLASNTIRTTALLFFIMVISLLTTAEAISHLPVGFIAVSLGLNWILMLYFGARLGRYKIMLYPLMFVVNPFFNWLYMVYGIFTAGQRTWGGPRADAGKADAAVTPEQAVEQAAAKGDELNVVPETFREPSSNKARIAPLQPSPRLEGTFRPAEELPGGWYRQRNDTSVSGAHHRRQDTNEQPGSSYVARLRSESSDSVWSHQSVSSAPATPRRVESLVAVDQAVSTAAEKGEVEINDWTLVLGNETRRRDEDEMSSASDDSSDLLHFHIPARGRRRPSDDERDNSPPSATPMRQPRHRAPSPLRHRQFSQPSAPVPPPRSPRRASQPSPAAHARGGQHVGRSPLARKSFTRLAADMVASSANRRTPPRRHSVDSGGVGSDVVVLERRGRRSVSVDRQGRRRLSKLPQPIGRGRKGKGGKVRALSAG